MLFSIEATEDAAWRRSAAVGSDGSIAGWALWEDGHGAVDASQEGLAVVQLHVVRMPADVRGIDLELHEHEQRLTGRNPAEIERDAPVAARLADRCGLQRVQVHLLEPAGIEDERRAPDLAPRANVKARHPEDAATKSRGRVDLQRSGGGVPARRRRPLAEDIERS